MKHSRTCPKCTGAEIVRVEGIRGQFGSGNVIPTGGLTIFSSIKVARYVCVQCGYSEEWIDSPDDLQRIRNLAETQGWVYSGALGGEFRRMLDSLLGNPQFEKLGGKPKDKSHG